MEPSTIIALGDDNNKNAPNTISPPPTQVSQKKVLLITTGTRGDINPFLALADSLKKDNWKVGLVSHKIWHETCAPYVDQFYGIEGNPSAFLKSEAFKNAIFGGSKVELGRLMSAEMNKTLEDNMTLTWQSVQNFSPDTIVCGIPVVSECVAIAQKLNIPLILATTFPFATSGELPPATTSDKPWSLGLMNKFLYWSSTRMSWLFFSSQINAFRVKELGLGTLNGFQGEGLPQLAWFSPHVVSRPKDWPETSYLVGYPFLKTPADYSPPLELDQFLKQPGSPPVYIGFGSMPVPSLETLARDFVEVLEKLNLRGIFNYTERLAFLSNDERAKKRVLQIGEVPHDWLFPRCLITIHHGGAGTTAIALRSGVPTIIYPLLGDQFFWASKVSELRVGPFQYVPLKQLNAEQLYIHIFECYQNGHMKRKSKELAEKLKDEDAGVSSAELVNRICTKLPHWGVTQHFVKDEESPDCQTCHKPFKMWIRRHHCRSCGGIFCLDCLALRYVPNYDTDQMVCINCWKKMVSAKVVKSASAINE